MKCPKCETAIKLSIDGHSIAYESDLPWETGNGFDIAYGQCPQCNQIIILIRRGPIEYEYSGNPSSTSLSSINEIEIAFPPTKVEHRPLDKEIPKTYRNDFIEAEKTLSLSSKASAALSRRLLQKLLREEIKVKPTRLAKEIEEFVSRPGTPSHIAEATDHIRVIGNFAAHPLKDTNTGEILDVEPGEAEWLLDVLESLFDFVFVQPKRLEERRNQIDKKIATTKPKPKDD